MNPGLPFIGPCPHTRHLAAVALILTSSRPWFSCHHLSSPLPSPSITVYLLPRELPPSPARGPACDQVIDEALEASAAADVEAQTIFANLSPAARKLIGGYKLRYFWFEVHA